LFASVQERAGVHLRVDDVVLALLMFLCEYSVEIARRTKRLDMRGVIQGGMTESRALSISLRRGRW
jgi:hypothetical protein